MVKQPNFKLTINFIDPELEPEERDREAQRLLKQVKELEEIEEVGFVPDPNPPEGNKTLGGFLVGLLTAEVSAENAKKVFVFLGDRLGSKPIELEVEANGKKLKVSAHSREELEATIKAAQDFVKV